MGKRIQVADHLTAEQLKDQYQHETDGRTRTHWQILWQIAVGKTAQEVADLTGLTVAWIREVVKRYNQHGPDAVGDQRHQNAGHHVCSTQNKKPSWWTPYRDRLPMANCGVAPKWPAGSAPEPVDR
jgi:Homeodomain-like domain